MIFTYNDKTQRFKYLPSISDGQLLFMQHHPTDDIKDAIEVYFDNQIGIIEVVTEEPELKQKKITKVAEANSSLYKVHKFDILVTKV